MRLRAGHDTNRRACPSMEPGDDLVAAGPGRDDVDAGTGDDGVTGSRGRARLRAGPGDDTLCGGPAPDVLDGGRGAGRDLPDGDGTSNRPRVGDTYISTDTYRLCLYQ